MKNDLIIYLLNPPKAQNTLFLDRDGVINEVVIRGSKISSPRNLKEVKISDDIEELSASLIMQNWNLIVVSNQPDLARGLIDQNLIEKINELIETKLHLNAVYICPHEQSKNCSCRKPEIGLIKRFRMDYPEIKGRELMVGDQNSDLECSHNAKIPFVLRKRNYNSELENLSDFVIDRLSDLRILLSQ